MSADALLEVRNLCTSFAGGVRAVRDVSFTVRQQEVLGLIGESGSGKTVTGLSILGLLPAQARVQAERLVFRGQDLLKLSRDRLRALRGVDLAMIFQDPVASFNPVKTVGWHLRQALGRRSTAVGDWRCEAAALLAEVAIRAPERALTSYPYQLSGGMLQRALIAMVIAVKPALIVADEPTTNLDNLVERQILDLIRLHRQRLGASVLFVTHDLSIAREICDRIAVMYAGEIVELGAAEEILQRPKHPYSAGLRATADSLAAGDEYLFELPGEPGQPAPAAGCGFAGRCPSVMPRCRTNHPALLEAADGHAVRCWLHAGI